MTESVAGGDGTTAVSVLRQNRTRAKEARRATLPPVRVIPAISDSGGAWRDGILTLVGHLRASAMSDRAAGGGETDPGDDSFRASNSSVSSPALH